MNGTIERITSQICQTTDATIQREDVRDIVRKTIRAMREPTLAVVQAGYQNRQCGHDHAYMWRTMIDEVLEE